MTHRFESRDVLVAIGVEILLGVVDCHAAVDIGCIMALCAQLSIWVLRHSFVRAILMSEVHHCRPVVRNVLGVGAGRTGTLTANVSFHRSIESISTDDLMNVGRGNAVRFDEGVKTLDCQCRASKPQGGVTESSLE